MTVTGANGVATAAVTLIPPAPMITGVGTNGQLPLGIFSATITGTGFQPSSVAKLNGSALGTTYSAGSLSVTGFSGQSGPASVTVSTSDRSRRNLLRYRSASRTHRFRLRRLEDFWNKPRSARLRRTRRTYRQLASSSG